MRDIKCSSCVKEPTGTIPIVRIIEKLDKYFAKNELEKARKLLEDWEAEARLLGDNRGLIEILSEEIGLYRRTGDNVCGIAACDEALMLAQKEHLFETVSGATIILNCATTYKAFGRAREALKYYEQARTVYEKLLPKNDFRLAGLYNNTATAYAELEEYDSAMELYGKAAEIIKACESEVGELAVTYVNMAVLINNSDPFDERACEYMDLAWQCLESEELVRDGNYAFIASKCAPAFEEFGWFIQAAELKRRSEEIYERN